MKAVSNELRAWMIAQAESGCRPEAIVKEMQKIGWSEKDAIPALELTLQSRLAEVAGARSDLPPAVPVPEPLSGDRGRRIEIGGRVIQVTMTMRNPTVILFDHLLSDAECDELIALASARLERSRTVSGADKDSIVHAARTSDGMFFGRGETPLVAALEQRIADLAQWPVENGEGLQVLRYRPGGTYHAHHDYFAPDDPSTADILKRGGQRVGTLVMYLNTPEAGGATTFPDVGVEVVARRGSAVFFSYDRAHPVTRTLHAGAPVMAGEKWVATKWFRERDHS